MFSLRQRWEMSVIQHETLIHIMNTVSRCLRRANLQNHFVWFNSRWYFPGSSILRRLAAGGGRETAHRGLLTILTKRGIEQILAEQRCVY